MKQKSFQLVSMFLLAVMVLSLNSFSALASSGSGTVRVGTGSRMMQAKTGITRTRKVSYATIKADSVYPTDSSTDYFTKCKTRLYHNTKSNQPRSNTYTINEGTSYSVKINEGYLEQDNKHVDLLDYLPELRY